MKRFEQFLKFYSKWLLWTFIVIIIANTIAVMLNPRIYTKEAVILDETQASLYIGEDELPPNPEGYERISLEELEELERKQTHIYILGFVCLLGLIIFDPEIRGGIKDIYYKVKEATKDEIDY